MKRSHISLFLGLAMAFALTGCTSNKAPNVTPTPSVAPTETVRPTDTTTPGATDTPGVTDGVAPSVAPTDDDGHYEANGDGAVEGTDGAAGKTVRNGLDEAGNVVRGAVRGTGRAIERVGDDIAGAVR